MALIVLIISSVLGTLGGLVQLLFLDASLGQAVLTYFVVSFACAAAVAMIGAAGFVDTALAERIEAENLEQWHDQHLQNEADIETTDRKAAQRRQHDTSKSA